MVRAENRAERRVAANIRTCACDSQLALATRIQKAMLRQRFLPSEVRGARRIARDIGGFLPGRCVRQQQASAPNYSLTERESK
jgi:hypothetical protein